MLFRKNKRIKELENENLILKLRIASYENPTAKLIKRETNKIIPLGSQLVYPDATPREVVENDLLSELAGELKPYVKFRSVPYRVYPDYLITSASVEILQRGES